MAKVLLLLENEETLQSSQAAQKLLEDFRISYELRIASASLAPLHAQELLQNFVLQDGKLILSFASQSTVQAAFASTHTPLPVISVNMREGILPSHTFSEMYHGSGESGLIAAAKSAVKILALSDPPLQIEWQRYCKSLASQSILADEVHRRLAAENQ